MVRWLWPALIQCDLGGFVSASVSQFNKGADLLGPSTGPREVTGYLPAKLVQLLFKWAMA